MTEEERRAQEEQEIVDDFLRQAGFELESSGAVSAEEIAVVGECLQYIKDRITVMTYPVGQTLDFALMAQQVGKLDPIHTGFQPSLTAETLLKRYPVEQGKPGKESNTLTISVGSTKVGIRKFENWVVELFNDLNVAGYSGGYVYNTGQWRKNLEQLARCFQLSEAARLYLCREVISYALGHFQRNDYYQRPVPRVWLLERMLRHYPRSSKGENGGLTFQALCFGLMYADRSHLHLLADKVRTGSARQKRIGDIDGYSGLDLELSVEVKDLLITSENFKKELGTFVRKSRLAIAGGLKAIVMLKGCAPEVRQVLENKGIQVLTEDDMSTLIASWDWMKQTRAVEGMLHFLAHVEQNPKAVHRLLTFIASIDPDHPSSAYAASITLASLAEDTSAST